MNPFFIREVVTAQVIMIDFHSSISRVVIINFKVSGFGATHQDGGQSSERLQVLNVNTMTLEDCEGIYPTTNMNSNMCTNNPVGQGFCTSDVGSPLVSNAQLIGIASWNVPCALGFPDLFVRISPYRNWIGSTSGV